LFPKKVLAHNFSRGARLRYEIDIHYIWDLEIFQLLQLRQRTVSEHVRPIGQQGDKGV
jgi:hypothetical protein